MCERGALGGKEHGIPIDLGDVIGRHLLDPALLLCLLLQRIEMLDDETTNRVVGLAFEEPRSGGDEGWTLVQQRVPPP